MTLDVMIGSRGAGPCADCGRHSPGRWPGQRCHPCWTRVVDERHDRINASQTVLYRLYDQHGQLLYIGITMDPRARWKDHRKVMPWWPEVHRRHLELYDTGVEAAAAEHAAIAAERPWYNRSGQTARSACIVDLYSYLPEGCPPPPAHAGHPPRAEYWPAWFAWRAMFREYQLNPEEREALGR